MLFGFIGYGGQGFSFKSSSRSVHGFIRKSRHTAPYFLSLSLSIIVKPPHIVLNKFSYSPLTQFPLSKFFYGQI